MEERLKNKQVLGAVLLATALISFFLGVKYSEWQLAKEEIEIISEVSEVENIVEQTEEKIKVHIYGAVENPGLYELMLGDRLEDLLNLARPLPEAEIDKFLNRAKILQDEDSIMVPRKGELPEEGLSLSVLQEKDGKININTATLEELNTLPGIGPVKAQAIIDYREKNGFNTVEDLLKVKGIGKATLEKVQDKIKAR